MLRYCSDTAPASSVTLSCGCAFVSLPVLQHLHHVGKLPKVRRDVCRHSRGAAQRLVNTNKIVMHGVDRDRMRVVLDFFGERIGQPGEPARSHPQRKVGPLGIAGADVCEVGTALDAAQIDTRAFAGAVAAQRPCWLSVMFDEHGVVDIGPEGLFNGLQIGLVAVAGELHPAGEAQCQIADEVLRRFRVTSADIEGRNQLGIGVNRHPRPTVTSAFWRSLGRLDVLGLGIDKRPNFINLETLASQVPHGAVLVVRECLSRILQQLDDGVLARAGHTGDGPDGNALDHHSEDFGAGFAGKLVHDADSRSCVSSDQA